MSAPFIDVVRSQRSEWLTEIEVLQELVAGADQFLLILVEDDTAAPSVPPAPVPSPVPAPKPPKPKKATKPAKAKAESGELACPEPGCGFVAKTVNGLGPHRAWHRKKRSAQKPNPTTSSSAPKPGPSPKPVASEPSVPFSAESFDAKRPPFRDEIPDFAGKVTVADAHAVPAAPAVRAIVDRDPDVALVCDDCATIFPDVVEIRQHTMTAHGRRARPIELGGVES